MLITPDEYIFSTTYAPTFPSDYAKLAKISRDILTFYVRFLYYLIKQHLCFD